MHNVAEAKQTLTAEYNGWNNRETWVINLWLGSEPEYYDVLSHITSDFEPDEQPAELEAWVREEFDRLDMSASLWSDLLSTALGRVDWYQIVTSNCE